MTRIMKLATIAAIAVGLCASGYSAETTRSATSTTSQESSEPNVSERAERIKEHQDKIRKLLEESRQRADQQRSLEDQTRREREVVQSTGSTSITRSSDEKQSSAEQERERSEGWRKFWEFYSTPEDNRKSIEFRGSDQEYANGAIKLKWHLGEEFEETTRTLSYQWVGTTTPATMLKLPDDSGQLLLRNNYNYIEVFYPSKGGQTIELHERIINSDYHVASNVIAPRSYAATARVDYGGVIDGFARSMSAIEFPVTSRTGQVVNDWVIFMRDGVVYAQDMKDHTQIKIGTQQNDYRPVGSMAVGIEYLDKITNAAKINVSQSYYPHTLFATDKIGTLRKIIGENGGELATKLNVLNGMAEVYGFNITWADQEAKDLAGKAIVTHELISGDTPQAMLRWVELILGDDFAPVAKGPEELHVTLSDDYRAEQELPAMIEKLRKDYQLETKLYVVKRIDPFNAMKVIERDMLGCYVIGKPRSTDVTSETLKVSGKYWAILKRPVSEKDGLEKELSKNEDLKNTMICEGIENDSSVRSVPGGGDGIVITATAETHGRVAAWLNEIEGEAKQTTLAEAANEPAPERRKLRVTLLQGGEAGAPAGILDEKGTTATYLADVPAEFGMTPDDLKVLGFDGAVVAGRGIVDLVAKPGELGSSRLTLGGGYGVTIQYRQEQGGFLMIDAAIEGDGDEVLAQNTIMLEKDKPSFLGVTNLSGAVIVVITWIGSGAG